MNANDRKIMTLKRQIDEKKAQLSGGTTFSPITNCSLELDGKRFNLHVLNTDDLTTLHVLLNMWRLSAVDIGVEDQLKLSGYPLASWITDVKARLMIVNRKQEEAKLKALESKLHNLLTSDTRVGLELSEIEKEI